MVTITGTTIGGDGVPYNGFPTDQDFALVCSNCRLPGTLRRRLREQRHLGLVAHRPLTRG